MNEDDIKDELLGALGAENEDHPERIPEDAPEEPALDGLGNIPAEEDDFGE